MTILTGSGSILILLKTSGELYITSLTPCWYKVIDQDGKKQIFISCDDAQESKEITCWGKAFGKN